MQPDDLEIMISEIEDGFLVRPVGEIDLIRAPSLRTHLTELLLQTPERLIVDLRDVAYLDSPAVATLIEALRLARRRGCLLVLCGLQAFVRSVFEISRVHDTIFVIVDTVDDALAVPNRRTAPRVLPPRLRCDAGSIVDVSTSGVRLKMRRRPREKAELHLRGHGLDLTLRGTLVWSRRSGLFAHEGGYHFIGIEPSALEQLTRVIEETLEEEDRRGQAVVG